ncbi:MAG: hypothetical protein ABI969_08100 [bacterium]
MTWFAQVWHVASKDLRQTRWLIIAYIALVAMVTVHASGLVQNLTVLDVGLILVVTMGMIIAASVVQADSPTRSDAFWASRPLYPLSVLTAKLVFVAAVVLGVGLLGQSVALRHLDVTGSLFASVLGEGATEYMGWLLIAMILAALSRDLRTVTVVLIVFGFAVLLLIGLFRIDVTLRLGNREALQVASALAAVGLLAYLYRTRDARRRSWVAAFVVFTASLAALWASFPGPAALDFAGARLRRLTLEASIAGMDTIARNGTPQLHFLVRGRRAGERVTFIPDQGGITFRWRGRVSDQLTFDQGMSFSITSPVPTQPGTRWLSLEGDTVSSFRQLRANLSLQQRDALRAGDASLEVNGLLVVDSAHVVATLPLVANAKVSTNGQRFVVETTAYHSNEVQVQLSTSAVRRSAGGASFAMYTGSPTTHALVNTTAHEAMVINPINSSAGSGGLVIPGGQASSGHQVFRANRAPSGMSGKQLDDSWFKAAKLTIVDWVPMGSVPVRATVTIH